MPLIVAVGNGLTVKVAVLPLEGLLEHVDAFFTEVIVTVVEPAFAKTEVLNVPVPPLIVNVAVLPVATFVPVKLYVTVKLPVPRLDEFIVIVLVLFAQTALADVEKLLTSGKAFTVKLAVLPLLIVLLQPVELYFIEVMVIVVAPALINNAGGIANVAEFELSVIEAVLPEDKLAPVKSYVTVKAIPLPNVFELTVTVEEFPKHGDVAEVVKLLTLGNGFTVTVALPDILAVHPVVAFVATTVYVPATV